MQEVVEVLALSTGAKRVLGVRRIVLLMLLGTTHALLLRDKEKKDRKIEK